MRTLALPEICEPLDWQRISPVGSKIAKKSDVITARRERDCIEIRGARQNNLKGIDSIFRWEN